MRVVFVTHNYPRAPGDLAGAFLHPLAVALRQRGHDVRVVAPSDAGRGGEEEFDGVRVTRVRYASPDREPGAPRNVHSRPNGTPLSGMSLVRASSPSTGTNDDGFMEKCRAVVTVGLTCQ